MNSQDYKSELINYIQSAYPKQFLQTNTIPKPFVGSNNVKAIVLGCDPGNITFNRRFKYAFGLEDKDSQYFKFILNNLNYLNLSLEDIYVQNHIQNYFKVETSNNKYWFECALLWLDTLKRELDNKFDRNIPVLITSLDILKVLIGRKSIKGLKAETIYSDRIIFKPKDNYLGRTVICLFRHPKYNLKHWPQYVNKVKKLLK